MIIIIQDVPGGKVNILGGHSIGHSKKKVWMYMCPIPNDFKDRAISLYISVSNIGIHCSSEKVDTVYLV
jgi:hypothetical protein